MDFPLTIVGIDDKCIFDRSPLTFWKDAEDSWGWYCPVCNARPLEESANDRGKDIFLWETTDVHDIPALRPDVLLINSGIWAREWRQRRDEETTT